MKVTFVNLILAALLISSQKAQAASCQGDIAIVNQQDLNVLRGCKTYGGNIVIDSTAATELQMPGIELIEGDLIIINNDGLQRLSLLKLQGVNGQIKLANNKILSTIEAKQLSAARDLEVSVHPALNHLKFPAGLSQVEKIVIRDTTATRIDGIKLSSSKNIEITNNIYLKTLSFGNMTSAGSVLISANSPSLDLEMDLVENVVEATFRNVARISLNALKKVNGDISFISNTFESLDLPATTEIGGTLTFTENSNLNNLSVPQLTHLGGALSINNNNKLTTVDGFKTLEQVDGTVDITGAFDDIQFPVLNDVRGGMNVQTSSNTFGCEGMNKFKNGITKGNIFVCKSAVAKPLSAHNNNKAKGGKGVSGESSGAMTLSYTAGYAVALGSLFTYFFAF